MAILNVFMAEAEQALITKLGIPFNETWQTIIGGMSATTQIYICIFLHNS